MNFNFPLSPLEGCSEKISVGIVVNPSKWYVERGVRCFRSQNVRENKINDSGWVFISDEGHAFHKKSRIQAGDVLVVRTGAPGTACVVTPEFDGANCIDVIIVRPDSKRLNPNYLSFFLNSEVAKRQISNLQGGMAQQHLNVGAISNLEVPLPDLSEQKAIGDAISIWQTAMEKIDGLVGRVRQRRQGLMQQLLTGKRRFPGFKQPWRRVEIGQVLMEVDRPIAMRDEEMYRLASVSRNWEGLFEREALYGRDIKTKNLREIKGGDFLISHIQAAYGALSMVPTSFDGFKVSNMYSCLRARDPALFDLHFFAYLAQQPRMTYLCRASSNGFFAERLRLNFMPEVFLLQTIDIPPTIEEQRRIITVLDGVDREIAVLEKLAAAYREQKRGLMQQLLTGKRRVKVQAA